MYYHPITIISYCSLVKAIQIMCLQIETWDFTASSTKIYLFITECPQKIKFDDRDTIEMWPDASAWPWILAKIKIPDFVVNGPGGLSWYDKQIKIISFVWSAELNLHSCSSSVSLERSQCSQKTCFYAPTCTMQLGLVCNTVFDHYIYRRNSVTSHFEWQVVI